MPYSEYFCRMNTRQLFQQYLAQTSPEPVALHVVKAEGNYLLDAEGKQYLDLIGGISVCNIGHGRKEVIAAVQEQAEKYMHIMVYGELIQSPQVEYAKLLADHLPQPLNNVYFTNSGAEAVEGAIKLAKRITGRPTIFACNKSYHGNTTGALSLMGDEYWRNAFRPLMPGVRHFDYNAPEMPECIDENVACVIVETVQAEAGVLAPDYEWMQQLQSKCREQGALLILDEIQCGFGRTGRLWGFEHYGLVPDVLLLGKALGGGMPLGAFISSQNHMHALTHNPVLGHITTFGGHPVCCAAGKAAFQLLLQEKLVEAVDEKEALFHRLLQHAAIKAVRSKGLLMAVELQDAARVIQVLQKAMQKGIFSDWFLFAPQCIRLAPPLSISLQEIQFACATLLECIEECTN